MWNLKSQAIGLQDGSEDSAQQIWRGPDTARRVTWQSADVNQELQDKRKVWPIIYWTVLCLVPFLFFCFLPRDAAML